MNHDPSVFIPDAVTRRLFLKQSALAAGAALAFHYDGLTASAAMDHASTPRLALHTPEDRKRSRFTGYTRQHWLEITERLLAGVLPYFDPKTGMPELKGVADDHGHVEALTLDRKVAKWQAMERIMMLAVYYTAATGRDRVPGWSGSITEVFRTSIRRMSNPADELFCPRTDPSVYMGSETALAILLSPKLFWEPFSAAEKERILTFLGELAYIKAYDNNHHLFHMVPVPILEQYGKPSNRALYTELLEKMLGWYRGDGWFIDGNNRGFDHYNFWGFQLYLNVLCHFDGPWRDKFGERFRTITKEFLQTAPYFYGRDGGPIAWGRSLAYRFADNSAIGWAHFNGANPLPPGLSRRIASGCLKYFWDGGAQSESGVLEVGYLGANAVVAENYVTDGTGYFAAQGLSCLLIPETDPFWTDKELPMPADEKGGRLALPGAEMTVRVSPADGEARLFPAGQPFGHEGQWQRGVKYCQHSYSSYLGWCALGEGSEDLGAGRTGYSLDRQAWFYRSQPMTTQVTETQVTSNCPIDFQKKQPSKQPSQPLAQLMTHTLIGDTGELHVIWHNHPQALYLHLGGYGINLEAEHRLKTKVTDRRIQIQGENKHSWMELMAGPAGRFEFKMLQPRPGWKHSHLFGGHGVFAFWQSLEPVASYTPVMIYVDGCRDRQPKSPPIKIQRVQDSLAIEFEKRKHAIALKI
jgi:hypothetical protein